MADNTERDLTEDEVRVQEEDGATADEAHRVGEFDDLRDRIQSLSQVAENILNGVSALREAVGAMVVDGGATVREGVDVDGDGDTDIVVDDVDLDTPIEELDFDLD